MSDTDTTTTAPAEDERAPMTKLEAVVFVETMLLDAMKASIPELEGHVAACVEGSVEAADAAMIVTIAREMVAGMEADIERVKARGNRIERVAGIVKDLDPRNRVVLGDVEALRLMRTVRS